MLPIEKDRLSVYTVDNFRTEESENCNGERLQDKAYDVKAFIF